MATLYNIFTYTYLPTHLLTYLSVNFGCVKNFATHHTDFTPFISFFCIHDIIILLMSIAMVAELRRAFSISWLGYR